MGFNYALVGEANQEAGEHEHKERAHSTSRSDWDFKEIKVGGELYGGLGDSTLGPTLNPDVTQQYAELNLKTEFNNGLHIMLGGAAGLTSESEHALVRLMLGYEFE